MAAAVMKVYQSDMFGGSARAGITGVTRRRLAEIMDNDPEAITNEDLLSAIYLQRFAGVDDIELDRLAEILEIVRSLDLRRRRQELRGPYPWPEEEEDRRQRRARREK